MDSTQTQAAATTIDDLVEDFGVLDDWEDRYRYVIELGKSLPELTPAEHNDVNKVRGCASQVWLVSKVVGNGEKRLAFRGDSDAHIVRGLIAILLSLYSGRTPREIVETDPHEFFGPMTPQGIKLGFDVVMRRDGNAQLGEHFIFGFFDPRKVNAD